MRILRFTLRSFLSVSHANPTEETIETPSVQRCAPEGSKALMIDLESYSYNSQRHARAWGKHLGESSPRICQWLVHGQKEHHRSFPNVVASTSMQHIIQISHRQKWAVGIALSLKWSTIGLCSKLSSIAMVRDRGPRRGVICVLIYFECKSSKIYV